MKDIDKQLLKALDLPLKAYTKSTNYMRDVLEAAAAVGIKVRVKRDAAGIIVEAWRGAALKGRVEPNHEREILEAKGNSDPRGPEERMEVVSRVYRSD